MTLIDIKQIEGLEEFLSSIFVSAKQDTDGTVTLTRSNGLFIQFKTGDGEIALRGKQGDKGDKGPSGYSVFELAQEFLEAGEDWATKIMGEKGETGDRGPNGKNGIDGTDFTIISVNIEQGDTFSATIDEDNNLNFTIPIPTPGEQGDEGKYYGIIRCIVRYGDSYNVTVTWKDTQGTLMITLPPSKKGKQGNDGDIINGSTEIIADITHNIVPEGSDWSCNKKSLSDNVYYDINFGKAKQGDIGAIGDKGLPGMILGALKFEESQRDLLRNFVNFGFTEKGHFITFGYTTDSNIVIGADINNTGEVIVGHEIHNIKNKFTRSCEDILAVLKREEGDIS